MKRSLSELICNDLSDMAYLGSDVIASEESIRTILHMSNERGLLSKPSFIHRDKLQASLTKIIATNPEFLTTPAHYQFFVEVGARSKAKQRDADTIHYLALDLFIRAGKKPLAFVADHYRGHDGYYEAFKQISRTLDIQFIIAGGSVYQADSVHCFIFTQMHLMLSASDERLLPLLEHIVGEKTEFVNFNWDLLPPEYLIYSQSVSMLFNYVDTVKTRSGIAKDKAVPLLLESRFDERLSSVLSPIIAPGTALHDKLRSKGIKYLAADISGKVVVELETETTAYTEAKLIDLCYRESYPQLHDILHKALVVQNSNKPDGAHPIFELAFSHAGILESCLINKQFNKIFNDPSILLLMQKRLIDPSALFNQLTRTTRDKEVEKIQCNQVAANLLFLQHLCTNSIPATKDELMKLLFSPKSCAFFRNELLVDLLTKRLIPLALVERIVPHQVVKSEFERLSESNRVRYLETKFPLVELVPEEEEEEADDAPGLFEVVEVVPELVIPSKPAINVELLVQSMRTSVFTSVLDDGSSLKVGLRTAPKVV